MLRYRGRYRDIGALEKDVKRFLNARIWRRLAENRDT
jgi:hypothetical protein